MKKHKRFYLSHAAIACLAVLILIGSGSIAYANDLGGIQRTIQLWIHGDQTEAVWEVENGHYHLTYQDADGETKERSGGGVAFNPDGTERPLTEEELMEDVYAPDIEYREDGSIWVYYFDQALEITDKFDDDNVCYLLLKDNDNGQDLYLTIKKGGGYGMSRNAYMQPWEFNVGP